ncbi:MAG: family 78 glycoside hydrolase catalytic domain, partial [Lachnospiraceae bacterium]|nr:family 78 glycoside hydrolase catalytic domain [Lachnospiraceae bacterium]
MQVELPLDVKDRQRITWKVQLWNEQDVPGTISEEAFFETGITEASGWNAKWISPELVCDPEKHKPASYLKKEFQCITGKKARLYVTALGVYEVVLNGERVGDFVLAPGSYDYEKHLAYQTYDVTELLKDGDNLIEVILGDGWYRSVSGVDGDRNLYGTETALLLQLEVDGKAVCVSDESWLASQEGPLRENDMQQGEVFDARIKKITGYHAVKEADYGYERLFCANSVPVKEQECFTGKLIQTPNGDTVIDYGQNLAGYIEFSLTAKSGQKIVLTHGETLDENGNFTQENFQDRNRHKEGGTRQQVIYTCREGENHYKSRFTCFGFRYAKVETDIDLTGAVFTAIAVYSEMEELGTFTCSNEKVNQLVQNSIWSMKSNFCDIPTDCPTRERAAWTGDMGVFIETGLSLADCYPVVRKWLGECRIAQKADGKVANIAPRNNQPSYFSDLLNGAVGWGDASILVPYAIYRRYGDKKILEENYDMMKRWYAFLINRAKQSPETPKMPAGMGAGGAMAGMQLPEGMQMTPELMEIAKKYMAKMQAEGGQIPGIGNAGAVLQAPVNPYEEYTINTGVDYGEWCEPDVDSQMAMRTPQTKVATAYFAYSGKILSEIAGILGKEEDAEHYREVADKARSAYRMVALQGKPLQSERQAEYIRAISFGLLSEEEAKEAAANLNQNVIDHDYHLNTGFLSTPDLCRVLADYGYVDTA